MKFQFGSLTKTHPKRLLSCFILVLASLLAACGGKIVTSGTTGGPGGGPVGGGPVGGGPGGTAGGPVVSGPAPVFTHKDPATGVVTRDTCVKDTDCAPSGATCVTHGTKSECYNNDDPCAKVTCGELERCEKGTGSFDKFGFCVPNCDVSKQCGGACTKSPTATCVDYKWVEPCSDSRNHCITATGPVCCNAGSECLNQQCIPVGEACDLTQEIYCKTTEYCDTSINKCVKYSDNPSICEFRPDSSKFVAKKKLNWNKEGVYSTPVVIDLDKDGIPEIIFNTTGYNLVAIRSIPGSSATDVTEMWNTSKLTGISAYSHVAPVAADLDGDGYPEVVALNGQMNGIIAIHGKDGSLYFNETASGMPSTWAGGISIGDIDGDGKPEIVALGIVWSNTGKELFKLPFDYSKMYLSSDFINTIPVLANIDNDPNNYLEIIDGLCVFQYVPGSSFTMKQVTLNDSTNAVADRPYLNSYFEGASSTSAVANFIGNASTYPQIVAVHNSNVYIADWRGNILDTASAPPVVGAAASDSQMQNRGARGGAPTIADFDGDGQPEIGVAFGNTYTVYDVNVDNSGIPRLSVLWSTPVQDFSSAITGSSVFDFDGDGKAEVVYNDEKMLHVFRGEGDGHGGGKVMFEVANSTGTAAESAVIADVDNDGHADIVVASNPYGAGKDNGLQVFSDINNAWVPTRPIWNQHAYSVTNINTDGTVPRVQEQNWKKPWLNNFRQNVQAGNPFLAPDFVVKVAPVYTNGCVASQPDQLDLKYEIQNLGSSTAKAGKVHLVIKTIQGGVETEVHQDVTTKDLPPNGKEEFSFTLPIKGTSLEGTPFDIRFVVDPDNIYNECNETNNTYEIPNVGGDAVDASAEVSADIAQCVSNHTIDVNVKIHNNGKGSIPANKINVKLYATIGSGVKTLIGTVDVTQPIPGESDLDVPYQWTSYDTTNNNKMIVIDAVIDEDNNLVECNESNNAASTTAVCLLLG